MIGCVSAAIPYLVSLGEVVHGLVGHHEQRGHVSFRQRQDDLAEGVRVRVKVRLGFVSMPR